MKRSTYKTAWVTLGYDCLPSYKHGHGAAVRPQTNNAIWDGVVVLWGRVAPFLSPWCAGREVRTGVNLNRYAGPGSHIRWHSDNEPLFGPQYSPKLIISGFKQRALANDRCPPSAGRSSARALPCAGAGGSLSGDVEVIQVDLTLDAVSTFVHPVLDGLVRVLRCCIPLNSEGSFSTLCRRWWIVVRRRRCCSRWTWWTCSCEFGGVASMCGQRLSESAAWDKGWQASLQ